jgi:ACS family hexuronate transporter-like MFS transporter
MRWKDDIDQIAQTGRVDQVVLRSVVLATLINSLGYMDRVSMSIVAPSLRSEFSFSAMQIGMIFGAFSLSYALFQTPWGMIADRWPVRNLVALVILVWSASTGLTALCSTFILFLLVRFLFGVSEAALSPMIAALFRRSVSSEWRPVAFGVFLAGGRVGGLIAPAITAFYVIHGGWRSVFLFFAALGVIAVIGWWIGYPRGELVERREPNRIRGRLPISISLLVLILVAFLYTFTWQFFATWFPTYLIESRHFSLQKASVFTGLPFFLGVLSTLGGGSLSRWSARVFGIHAGRRIVVSGSLAASGGFFLCGALMPSNYGSAILISLAAAAGDLVLSTLWASAVELGRGAAGAVAGLMNATANLGAFLSPLLVGKMLESGGRWPYILETGALINIASAILWIFFRTEDGASLSI